MFQQLQFIFGSIFSIPLFPFLYWQGKTVRARIPKLPEAEILENKIIGKENPINLLFMGDSAVAGVGVKTNEEGLAGNVSREIHSKTGQTISWKVIAKSGYTAQQSIKELLPQVTDNKHDIIIVGLGANDVFDMNSPIRGRFYLKKFIKLLREKQPNAPILIINMPPFGELLNFPKLLSFYLDNLTRLHAEIINDVPKSFKNVFYLKERVIFSKWKNKIPSNLPKSAFFATDGVHPSALTYQVWGKEIANEILRRELV